MFSSSEHPSWSSSQPVRCPQCGQTRYEHETVRDECATAPVPEDRTQTTHLRRPPSALPRHQLGTDYLVPDAPVTLQFLPSGACLTFTFDAPMIVGRAPNIDSDFIDLTSLNAYQHGVSRQHCTLRRNNTSLVVTDLDSTNGTFLNGERLIPYRDYGLHDGDRLILGTLHVTVHFSTLGSAQ